MATASSTTSSGARRLVEPECEREKERARGGNGEARVDRGGAGHSYPTQGDGGDGRPVANPFMDDARSSTALGEQRTKKTEGRSWARPVQWARLATVHTGLKCIVVRFLLHLLISVLYFPYDFLFF